MIGPLAYIGGKRRLASRLIALFPPHVTYVEPFAGGAQVFFAKPPSRVEVLNDLNGELVNFLRICQHHPEELVRCLDFAPASRVLFRLFAHQDPAHLTDVQRAARFLYLQKNGFGGKVVHQNYHFCVQQPPNYDPLNLAALIDRTARRLARVQLESWPYDKVLERFDRPTTFFYLDPPYVGLKLYPSNFKDADFQTLAEHLAGIEGRFLLSINDHPVAREAFSRFHLADVSVSYTASLTVPTVRELVVANYPLPTESRESLESSRRVA